MVFDMNKIKSIYNKLYKAFGAQGWGPVTPSCCRENDAKPVYGIKTRTDNQRFEIIAGAILTQNTAWKNAEKAIGNLFRNNLLSAREIRKINKNKLAGLIRSAGYYNQKAERLKIIAEFLSKNPIRKLAKLLAEELRKKLLEIKGIGPETADSILLYAFNKPVFVIDAYTKRIFERLGYKEKGYDGLQRLFMGNLPKDHIVFNEYHALLVELGKNYCRKEPCCEKCPLIQYCSRD